MADFAIQAGMLKEEKVGLGAAIVLHILLVAVLALQIAFATPRAATPPRMTVNLATEVSLESAAPEPVTASRAAIAPTLSDEPAPEADPAPAETTPKRAAPPPPPTQTRTPARTTPRTPAPARDRSRPDRDRKPPTPAPSRNAGGSRIGDNFLTGQGGSTQTDETRIPASQIGQSARASIGQQLSRQLRPYWDSPPGLDADQLVTVLAFRLNEDGSLAGRPRVVSQSGINDSNRRQAPLHAERAIRAVQRAAPFDLPPEYYNAWKSINGARFDRNL